MCIYQFVRPISFVRIFVAGFSALMLLPSGGLLAQQTQTTGASSQPTPAASPTATPRATSEAATAERVVVTASKREENIQEVPSSISVINDVELDNIHATQLTDYSAYVPGLQVNSLGGPGQSTISLRGLAPLSSGATTAIYVDEIPTGSSGIYQRQTALELDLLPYDIRRIEILRGPQGTLYGANSLGGLVKYVTLEPDLTTSGFRFGGGVSGVENGDDLGWDVHGEGNVALAHNTLALRVSYARNEIPGFIDNHVNGDGSINSGTQQGILASLLWKPNDTFSLKLTAIGQKIYTNNNTLVALGSNPSPLTPPLFAPPKTKGLFFGDLTNEVFVNEPFTKKIGIIAGTLNVNLDFADLTSVTAYSNTKTDSTADATVAIGRLFGGISFFNLGLNIDKFTQELRLTSKPGNFLWQVGGFYTYERSSNSQAIFARQPDGTPFTGPLAVFNTLADLTLPSRYTEYAGFANASYQFTDWFKLGAGVRVGRNEQSFAQNVTAGIILPIANTPGGSREVTFDYMVSPEVHLTKDVLLYFRLATGYQPGGPNVALPGVPPSVNSTTDTSYELGLKSEFFDHRLLFNIAGYHIDLDDLQVIVATPDGTTTFAVNGGTATSDGIEFTLGYQPIKSLTIGINGAYTDATLSENAPQLNGLAGDRLPFIPVFSGAITADYYFPLGGGHDEPIVVPGSKDKDGKESAPQATTRSGGWTGHVGAALRYVGNSRSAVESSPTAYRVDSYAALDLNADVSNGRYLVRVFARNVTDERAYTSATPVSTSGSATVDHLAAVPIQPRTVGVEFDFKF